MQWMVHTIERGTEKWDKYNSTMCRSKMGTKYLFYREQVFTI